MKYFLTLLCLLGSASLPAQNVQSEIDQQIWIPFTQAWEANDGKAFNEIHADDVRRINPGILLLGEEYKARNLERMNDKAQKRIIEFSFETRTQNGLHAYEVGYYRITDTSQAEPR